MYVCVAQNNGFSNIGRIMLIVNVYNCIILLTCEQKIKYRDFIDGYLIFMVQARSTKMAC